MGDFAPAVRGSGNYQSLNSYLSELFLEDDFLFANLETPLTTHNRPRVNKKYCFKIDPDFIHKIPKKFVFSIANNHIMDYGEEGLIETIETLENNGFYFSGAGRNIDEAGKPAIIKYGDHKLGFLAAADRRYLAATESTAGVFPALSDSLIPRITEIRDDADLVIISIHMGMEYIPIPTPAMRKLSSDSQNAGADIVLFHHAHCVSGYTVKENKMTIWGAGNFLFPRDQNFPYKEWFDTAVWQIPYNFSTNRFDVNVQTYRMKSDGIPINPDKKTEEQIFRRIENYSSLIRSKKNLLWHILRHLLRMSYLRVFAANYIDMMRRTGFKSVLSQMCSSVKELFPKRN